MYNNDDYSNFNNSNSLFGNNNQNNNLNHQNGMVNSSLQSNNNGLDVPPELDEIKNLNDATIASAPTMDVLGPMNVMPNSLPTNNNDKLDDYEKGITNINDNNINNDVISNVNNSTINDVNSNLNNNFVNNMDVFSNQNVSAPLYNNYEQNNLMNNDIDNNFINNAGNFNNQNINTSSSINTFEQNNIVDNNELESVKPDYNQTSNFINNNIQNDYELPNKPLENNNFNSKMDEVPSSLNEITTNTIENNNIDNNSIDNNQNISIPNTLLQQQEEPPKIENDSKDYNIVQDKELKEDVSKEDLGLDYSYTEPDVLEIMDLDQEPENENNSNAESLDENNKSLVKEEENTTRRAVDKIKSLIEELKTLGYNIEFDEFDFEELYQLIIKLKK